MIAAAEGLPVSSEEPPAVATALSGLPIDHPARSAYANGADTIAVTRLVAERRDIAAN